MKARKRAAQIVLALVITLFAIAAASVFAPKKAQAAETWTGWGAAPYASSFEEACKKAPNAIDGFAWPVPVKEYFKKLLGTTCEGGVEVWLTPHDSLKQMWTGGKNPHVMNDVTVGELPVLKAPDGRPYRKGAVAEAAKALEWVFVHEGQSYVLDIPFVCFNFAWRYAVPPVVVAAPPPEKKLAARPVATGICPNGRTFMARAYSMQTLPSDLRKQAQDLIAAAEKRDSNVAFVSQGVRSAQPYMTDAVSRTIGRDLYEKGKPIADNITVAIRLLNPETLDVVEDLGTMSLTTGVGTISMSASQRAKIIETTWPGHFNSPAVSNGSRRIWFFPFEWSRCTMVVSAIAP